MSQSTEQARTELLDYYSGHQRYWGTNLLTIVVATFSILLVRKELSDLGMNLILWPSLLFTITNMFCALLRIIWYGALANYTLNVVTPTGCLSLQHGSAIAAMKKKPLSWLLCHLVTFKAWVGLTVVPTIVVLGILLYIQYCG